MSGKSLYPLMEVSTAKGHAIVRILKKFLILFTIGVRASIFKTCLCQSTCCFARMA